MSARPEALRLAAELSKSHLNHYINHAAAAELRRLHAENERLHQINQSHEMKLSVRGYEIQIADLEAQRDALLEALRLVQVDCQHLHHEKKDQHTLSQPCPVVDRINAAIKAVEGEKE